MTTLAMFNQLKSIALGLDSLFKSTGQTQVKFHQVNAAVFLAVAKKLEEFETNYLKYHSDPVAVAKDIGTADLNHAAEFIKYHKRGEKRAVLIKLFGDNVHETSDEEVDALCDFIHDVARGIESASDDRALNNVMNNYRYVDMPGRFPSYIDDEPQRSSFKGHLVINHSYQKKDTLEPGDTVNIVLTIDRGDATALVHVVQPQLEALGLVVGRLTSTTDTAERHVSFGLRMSYTAELGQLVQRLNDDVLPQMTLETAAQLQVVTPMDIRTSRSAISLLSPETCERLRALQQQVYAASGATGNDLPRMHITHGNSPITAASHDDILAFLDKTYLQWESALHPALEHYGLNLRDALKTKNNSELFQNIVSTGTWTKFPTCHVDIPEAVEKIKQFMDENNKNAHSLQIISDVIKFLIRYENDLPSTYLLEKAKKNDYERKLAWFFGWAAYEGNMAILHAERFAWLYKNFPESSQSALDVAVAFEKKGFLRALFSIIPLEDRAKFISKSMKIAAAMNHRDMLLFIHRMMLEEDLSMDSLRSDIMKDHPIDECIRHNHLETLELLLQLGVPVDVPEGEFSMDLPLGRAVRFNRSDCVALLIKYGAHVNAKNSIGGTALEYAITRGHWDIAHQLIQAGAENQVNKKGKTILDLITSEEKRLEVQSWFHLTSMASAVTPDVTKSEEQIKSTSSIPKTTRPYSLKGINFFAGSSGPVISNKYINGQKIQKDLTEILKKSDEMITPSDQADLDAAGIRFI